MVTHHIPAFQLFTWQSWVFIATVIIYYLGEISIFTRTERKIITKNEDQSSYKLIWIFNIIALIGYILIVNMADLDDYNFVPNFNFPIGIACMLYGTFYRQRAMLQIRKFFSVKVQIMPKHELITTGEYATVRHPAYSGALLSALGACLVSSNLFTLLFCIPLLMYAYAFRIYVEEKSLMHHFKSSYARYCKQTKWRMIPYIY